MGDVADGDVTLVFTHGYADTSATWSAQVDDLGRDYDLVTWDLPGHGQGTRDPELSTREGAIGLLDYLIDEVGTDVVLVGHSLGGYLSMVRTARNPERVRSLVLIATGPGYRDDAKREEWNRSLEAVAADQGLPPEAVMVGRQPDSWLMDHLADIEVPALLLVGSDDRGYRAGMDYLAARLPGARPLLVVEGGRHMVHRKYPAEVNAAIRAFLDE